MLPFLATFGFVYSFWGGGFLILPCSFCIFLPVPVSCRSTRIRPLACARLHICCVVCVVGRVEAVSSQHQHQHMHRPPPLFLASSRRGPDRTRRSVSQPEVQVQVPFQVASPTAASKHRCRMGKETVPRFRFGEWYLI